MSSTIPVWGGRGLNKRGKNELNTSISYLESWLWVQYTHLPQTPTAMAPQLWTGISPSFLALLLWEYSITATEKKKKTNTKPYSLIAHSLFNAFIDGLIHWESYQHKAPFPIAHSLCNESISGLIHRGSYQSLFSTTTREPHFQYVGLGEGDISYPNYNNMGSLR